MTNKEFQKKIDDEYYKRMQLIHDVFPDMLIQSPYSAGYLLITKEQYYMKRKIEEFVKEEQEAS